MTWEEKKAIQAITARIHRMTSKLQSVLNAAPQLERTTMPAATFPPTGNPTIDALGTAVTNLDTVVGSAETLINGINARIQAAVAAALAGGATPAQLAAVTAITTDLTAQSAALAQAVADNTSAAAKK